MREYLIQKEIARGTYGQILLVKDIEEKKFVIKKISKKKMKKEKIEKEIKAGKKLNHPNIIKFFKNHEDENFYYLLLEYIDGLDLFNYLNIQSNPLSEYEIKLIFYQLVKAIQYVHEQGICHRDLKLENIIIDKKFQIKILDFGFCEIDEDKNNEYLFEWCGTLEYVAPGL